MASPPEAVEGSRNVLLALYGHTRRPRDMLASRGVVEEARAGRCAEGGPRADRRATPVDSFSTGCPQHAVVRVVMVPNQGWLGLRSPNANRRLGNPDDRQSELESAA